MTIGPVNPKDRVVLVVDDLPENTEVLVKFLQPMGFKVLCAYDGEGALESVRQHRPDVILLDLNMPGMDGFEVCQSLKEDPSTRHIPVIIITGLADKESNVKAVAAGADDFLIKPFDRVLLEARLRSSLHSKVLQDKILEYQRELEGRVSERTRQVVVTQQVAVFSLAKLAESRDNETGDHLERMREYAHELAKELAASPKHKDTINAAFVEQLYQSTPLHDIGKVGIPDRILLKPGKLSPAEFEIMKTHAVIGGDTLRAADLEAGRDAFLAMGRDIAYYHHERWDGKGYPYGVSGVDIPLPARIAALADVYDALTSKRPYKEAFTHEHSRGIILQGRGSHFDPDVVDAFIGCEQRFIDVRVRLASDGKLSPLEQLARRVDELEAASPAPS